jgi:hypothetical protein
VNLDRPNPRTMGSIFPVELLTDTIDMTKDVDHPSEPGRSR